MADVDETKVGKTGVGSTEGDSSQLSEGQKMFAGKVTPAPTSKIDRLMAKGAALAKQNQGRHVDEMDTQGEHESLYETRSGTFSHYQTPFQHIHNRESKGK